MQVPPYTTDTETIESRSKPGFFVSGLCTSSVWLHLNLLSFLQFYNLTLANSAVMPCFLSAVFYLQL